MQAQSIVKVGKKIVCSFNSISCAIFQHIFREKTRELHIAWLFCSYSSCWLRQRQLQCSQHTQVVHGNLPTCPMSDRSIHHRGEKNPWQLWKNFSHVNSFGRRGIRPIEPKEGKHLSITRPSRAHFATLCFNTWTSKLTVKWDYESDGIFMIAPKSRLSMSTNFSRFRLDDLSNRVSKLASQGLLSVSLWTLHFSWPLDRSVVHLIGRLINRVGLARQ